MHGVIPCSRGRRGLAGVGVGVDRAVLKLPCTKFSSVVRCSATLLPATDRDANGSDTHTDVERAPNPSVQG